MVISCINLFFLSTTLFCYDVCAVEKLWWIPSSSSQFFWEFNYKLSSHHFCDNYNKAIASCTRSIVTGTRHTFKNSKMPLSSSFTDKNIRNCSLLTDKNIRNWSLLTDKNIRKPQLCLRIKISGSQPQFCLRIKISGSNYIPDKNIRKLKQTYG